MPWKCRLVDGPHGARPGDMWFAHEMVEGEHAAFYKDHYLSAEYLRDCIGKRPPIIVILPDGSQFCVDSCAKGSTNGWTVTGREPNITVSPSINAVGRYHGFLSNGVLSDDVEGRQFKD